MFIDLETTKGEKVSVNVDKVLFFAETKKCCSIVLEDGTFVEVLDSYEELVRRFTFQG